MRTGRRVGVLWRAAPNARWLLLAAVAASLVASGVWYIVLVTLAGLVAGVFIDGRSIAALIPVVGVMIALLLLRSCFALASDVLAQRAASEVKDQVRSWLSRALIAHGPAYVRGERSGELVHLATDGIERLDEYVARYLPARYAVGLAPALVVIAVALVDPITVPVLLFTGPLLVVLLVLIGRRARDLTTRRENEIAWMNGHFLDMLLGLPTLKLFGRSREQVVLIADVAERLATSSMDVLRTVFQTSLVLEWGATAATALVAIEVSIRLMAGDLGFDRALAVLLLTPEFFAPLRAFGARYHAEAAGRATMTRLIALEAPVEPIEMPTTSGVPATFDISFREVTVTFAGRELPALDRASLQIDHGAVTAITAPTGTGKSTLAAVLLRFLEPDSGVIEIAGVPLASMDAALWRRQVAWVPQHPHLFNGSVLDNLRVAQPDATLRAARAAARAAGIDDVVQALPQRYDCPIGEAGARLSGGERQRLVIARAFLRDAPVLLLDEPTSHLDSASAAWICDALRAERGRRTVVVITHDPGLLSVADSVVSLTSERAVAAPLAALGGPALPPRRRPEAVTS